MIEERLWPIQDTFPEGLLLNSLIHEMTKVWPEDLWRCHYTVLDGGRPTEVVKKGVLIINAPRYLTKDETSAANEHFLEHKAKNPPVGFCLNLLPDPDSMAGQQIYCYDCLNPQGIGSGGLLYSNGKQWLQAGTGTPPEPSPFGA